MKSENRPLLDHAAGELQDRRSALIAAFRRIAESRRKKPPTNLHVRELLTYILARDGGSVGIKISYGDLARVLDCDANTARYVVHRAVLEFGLVEAIEQRYSSSAQDANLYRIVWPVVRRINSESAALANDAMQLGGGATGSHPPVTESPPPANQLQGGATQSQPTTLTLSLTSSLEETTTTVNRSEHSAAPADPWQVVVVALEDSGVIEPARAIVGAKKLKFTPERCLELVEQWKKSEVSHIPGALYRWLTMPRSAPRSKPTPKPSPPKYVDQELRRQRDLNGLLIAKKRSMLAANSGRPLTEAQLQELSEFISQVELQT